MAASRSNHHPVVRWAAIGLVALLVVGLVAGVAASIGGGGDDSSPTTTESAAGTGTESTVARDGDPAFCGSIVGFQDAYLAVAEPDPALSAAEVEAQWDALAAASATMLEAAPQNMAAFAQPVVSAFDTLRQDAQAAGFEYTTLDDLESSATLDPDGTIAQSAYALFSYGEDRCPLPAGGDPAGTTTTAAAG